MALVTTPGASNANSFATVAEFKTYRDNRLPAVAAVSAATDPQIEAALIVAARDLGTYFQWTGTAVDDVQALTWPRIGMLTRNGFAIPTSGSTSITIDLKNAQCEWAFQLLAGANFTADDEAAKAGLSSVKAGSVALSFQSFDPSSVEAIDWYVRKLSSEFAYIQAPGEVRRLLVPSWFEQPSVKRPIIFGAM